MYIPRPAKLLFTIDDGWNKFIEKLGDNVNPWTRLPVKRMLACVLVPWAYDVTAAHPFHVTTAVFSAKATSACGFKATEQWIAQQQHILPDCDWQHITFTMPHLLWPFFNNNWPLLNALFRAATRAMLRWARKQGVEIGIFCALHTYGRQLNQHPHIPVTRGGLDVKHAVWRCVLFKKKAKKFGAAKLSGCCVRAITAGALWCITIMTTIRNNIGNRH